MAELNDKLNWIAENLRIITKRGDVVNLRPNFGQLQLHNSMQVQRDKGLPVRICLLKPRRVGWSTWCVGDSFCDIYNTANLSALEVSADDDSTDAIFRMAKRMNDSLPVQRKTEYSNRKEIVFSQPHGSRIIAQTAGKIVLGRGSTFQRLHCSEVAFWRNAAHQLGGLYQVVANEPGTVIVLETTANGVGGAFYDTFWNAVDRLKSKTGDYNGFLPVFFPWYKFPEYKQEIPDGVHFEPDYEAKEVQALYNLTNEQLYWRYQRIVELNGDVDMFRQEYPATAREAFITSGRAVFPQSWISKQRTAPGRTALLVNDRGMITLKDTEQQLECWRIWQKPIAEHQYTIGVDTMEGRALDGDNPRSKLDYHGIAIYDRMSNKIVAQYQGRCLQHDLARQVLFAGKFYNDAWIGIELPNGKTVLDYMVEKGYQHLYKREKYDLQDSTQDTPEYGWRTTTVTRPWLVDGLLGLIREGELEIYSKDILGEMATFTRDKVGKPIHLPGEHDDLLFGVMIAIQVHIRSPLNPISYPFDHTDSAEEKKRSTIGFVGAVDDFSDMFADEEVGCYTE